MGGWSGGSWGWEGGGEATTSDTCHTRWSVNRAGPPAGQGAHTFSFLPHVLPQLGQQKLSTQVTRQDPPTS